MSPPSVSKSLCLALQKPIKSTAIVLSTHVMAPSLFLSTLFKTRSMLCSSSAVEVNMTMFCINESNGPEVCACRGIERIRRAINNGFSLDTQQLLQNISQVRAGCCPGDLVGWPFLCSPLLRHVDVFSPFPPTLS